MVEYLSVSVVILILRFYEKCAGYFNVESIISECIDQGKTHMQKDW